MEVRAPMVRCEPLLAELPACRRRCSPSVVRTRLNGSSFSTFRSMLQLTRALLEPSHTADAVWGLTRRV